MDDGSSSDGDANPTPLPPPAGIATPAAIAVGTGAIQLYINYLTHVNNDLVAMLYNLSIPQLQEILANLRPVIFVHEHAFLLFNHYVRAWEYLDLDIPYMGLVEDWREVGNNITETYRTIENLLGISREQSAYPTQIYEH